MAIDPGPDPARRFDMRALWRMTGWGVAAALSLGTLAIVTQTDIGARRLQLALAPAEMPVHAVAVVKVPPLADTGELAQLKAKVRDLTADRERLGARVAILERDLGDLTGSIKKQVEAATAAAAAKREKPATPPPAVASPQVIAPLAMAPVESKQATWGEAQHEADQAPEATASTSQTPERGEPPAEAPKAAQQQPAPKQAAPEPHAAVPLPPVRMAALPPKPAFGIALAGASNVALLHMQWGALKANFAPLLGDLQPHMLRERRGRALHYRLIVGPLPTYTAAARLCARLIRARAVCHPVRMAGEPL